MRVKKKILVYFLMMAMLLCLIPTGAFAATEETSIQHSQKIENTIKIGDYITLGTYYNEPIVWRCVAIDENGPLMLSDKILCLKAFDASGDDSDYHSDGWGYIRKNRGSNCWSDSNLRQWLNSSNITVDWSHCSPTEERVYQGYNAYADEAGFLTGFNSLELSMIKTVTQKSYINSWETKRNGYYDGGSSELIYWVSSVPKDYDSYYYQNVTDMFFLLNPEQADAVYQNLGEYLYDAYPTQSAVNNSSYKHINLSADKPWQYWLGVPRNEGASYEGQTIADGTGEGVLGVGLGGCYNGTIGVRPAFYLDLETYNDASTKFSVTTDHTNLSVRKDNKILLGVGLFSNSNQVCDLSGITFQIEDSSVLELSSSFTKDDYLYTSFVGIKDGTTNILFNDTNTGAVVTIPVTVYSDNYLCYTLSSVPLREIEKYPTNFYNVNGLYVDSYTYTVNADKSASVSFDVYNSNYTYGVVEIYDVNGNLKNAVLIDKMSSGMTSMKEILWDNTIYLVRDIYDGDLLSYRQESGFSKKTSVSVTIPKNGYIKISNDPVNSFIVGVINSVDHILSLAQFMGEITGYDTNVPDFSQKLTLKLVNEKLFAECVKDGSKLPTKLWTNIGKEIVSSSDTLASFSETIIKNIENLELEDVIISTGRDFGINIGQETFTYFAGPFGIALKTIFTIGSVEDILVQQAQLTQSSGIGSIYIQNQGGGVLGSQQITVEKETSFDSDTALCAFSVSIDPTLLSKIEAQNPALFRAISQNASYTYDITLLKNGQEVQPGGKTKVCIPIPDVWRTIMPDDLKQSIYAGIFKIYRIEKDGSAKEMPTNIKGDCFVFETDHFSLYTLVQFDCEEEYQEPHICENVGFFQRIWNALVNFFRKLFGLPVRCPHGIIQ